MRAEANAARRSVETAPIPAPTPAALSVRGLTVHYRDRAALSDLDVEIAPGRMVAVVGPNGAGKSTLIRAALGLVPMQRGTVRFFGRSLDAARDRIAYVPQRESVDWDFPVTAIEVVTMGLYRRIGWLRPVRRRHREIARAALDRLGIAELADRQISQLSGGQQQRIFLARALVQEAELLLMDEPLAGVDATTEEIVLDLFERLRAEGRTVVVIHHDLDTVRARFDDAILLNGRLIAAGPVNQVLVEEQLRDAYGGRIGRSVERRGRSVDESGTRLP